MSEQLNRVLVALDASPLSLAALEAAAVLAQRAGAELLGVFVEDVNLTRLAGHPAAASISLVGGLRRDPGHRLLEDALKLQVTAARRAFADAAGSLGGTASFAVRQGRVDAELLAAAAEADLILLGCSGRVETLTRRGRLGSTARALIERAARPVLVMRQPLPAMRPVAVLYDGSAAARRAMTLAARLAMATGTRLEIITAAPDRETAARREREARGLIEPYSVPIEGHPVAKADSTHLAAETARHPLSVLVLPETARHLMDVLPCSVVVVP